MKDISRRLRLLEERLGLGPAVESWETRELRLRLKAAGLRSEAHVFAKGPEKGVRLRIPALLKASFPYPVQRLNAARDLYWRQSLFDECQATSAEMGLAVTERERAAAQAHCAELELQCQRSNFASSQVFLQDCRDRGWLSCESPIK
jgi:hypothetical protein